MTLADGIGRGDRRDGWSFHFIQRGVPRPCNITAFSRSINELPLKPKENPKLEARHVQVPPERAGQRIDNYLLAQLKGVPKAAIYRIIRTGQVRINGKRCKPEQKVASGDDVRIPPVRLDDGSAPPVVSDAVLGQIRLAILHEDANYLIINKPAGMAVHSGSGLPWGLIDAVRQARPGEYMELAHRIDRETSGCVVLARNGPALRHLADQFRDGAVVKKYLCLMDGRLREARVDVDAPLLKVHDAGEHHMEADEEGKAALTRFRALENFGDSSFVEAELFTGRTHQIRAHAAHLGLPLAGDDRYSPPAVLKKWRARGLKRMFLHAQQIGFTSIDGTHIHSHAVLPPDLRAVLDRLEV